MSDKKNSYVEKLEQLGADKDCPACGVHPDWVIIESFDADNVTAVLPHRNFDMKMGTVTFAGTRVVNVACNNCGYIRQHMLTILNRDPSEIKYFNGGKNDGQ
jgi:rubredoxin